MKYLAILKDSLREALDSAVLYVMIALSTLVILFVGTLSFKPLPAEKTMSKLVDGTIGVMLDFQKNKKMSPARMRDIKAQLNVYQLKKVEVLKGEPDSPDSEYRLTMAIQFPGLEDAIQIRQDPQATISQISDRLAAVADSGYIRFSDVDLAPLADQDQKSSQVLFVVNTKPTTETRRIWFTEPSLFFGAIPLSNLEMPLGLQLFALTSLVISIGSWVVILTGVVITSFFIPNMMRKGTIDLLLVKPIHRWGLLLYKYIGGLTFIFLNNAYAIIGIWLMLGLRSGIWANWFLLLIFVLTFFFAILYAVSTFIAVLTRSTVSAILVTIGFWFICFVFGFANQIFEERSKTEKTNSVPVEQRWGDNAVGKVVNAVHAVLPRTSDLSELCSQIIMTEFLTGNWSETDKLHSTNIDWGESLLVSGAFIAILLGLSCWRFGAKDY